MATDNGGVSDAVEATLNPEPDGERPEGVKGPAVDRAGSPDGEWDHTDPARDPVARAAARATADTKD